jgi:hypothetical protein
LVPFHGENKFHPLLDQGWTLSFEMLFYLVFALSIVLGIQRWRLAFLAAAFLLLALLSHMLPFESGARYLLSDPIVIEFVFGVCAAEVFVRYPPGKSEFARKRVAATLVIIGILAFLPGTIWPQPDSLRFLFYGVPSFLLVLGAAYFADASPLGSLVFLGDASYSIYLIHGFLSLAYTIVLRRFPLFLSFSPDLSIVVLTCITIPLTSLGYVFIERPLMNWMSGKRAFVRSRA